MAVPMGVPVEESIREIDADIRMEDIRQSPAARLKMEHFHASIKRNLMDKKLNYEAEHRKEILEGLKHMKRQLPVDPGASLARKLESLSVNLECLHQNENDTFLMKNEELTLSIKHINDKALATRVYYYGEEFPSDDEICRRINENAWEDLRNLIHSMLRTVPPTASLEMKKKLSLYRRHIESCLRSEWTGGESATISQVNESLVGWPSIGTSLHPQQIFIYGEPGMEIELRAKGRTTIDPSEDVLPYAEIVIVEAEEEKVFSLPQMSFSYRGIVKLELSSRWILSASTVEELARLGASPSYILQRTNMIRLVSNCLMKKESNLELVGRELGRDVVYRVGEEWMQEEKDVIVEGLLVEDVGRLKEILLLLHRQALFNSSWQSVVASCCTKTSPSSIVRFDLVPRDLSWEIQFGGMSTLYTLRLSASRETRHWSARLFTAHDLKQNELADEIEGAFNNTWSLSKCLAHLITRLGLSGQEWRVAHTMDTSLPPSHCSSLTFSSKVGSAWLRNEAPRAPPPLKHEYRVSLPKGRCSLLRMMREVKPRKPFKVARPYPQLYNPTPTVPPLRVNRMEVGLPPLQQPPQPPAPTPFNQIENMVKSVEDSGRSSASPMGILPPQQQMQQMEPSMYGLPPVPGYAPPPMGMHHRMGMPPPGTSPLVRGGPMMVGGPLGGVMSMGGGGGGMMPGAAAAAPSPVGLPAGLPPYGMLPQHQQDMMRHQQLMRQQSSASIGSSGVFDFPEEMGSNSPASNHDFSPGGYSTPYNYAPPQSPLVRGGSSAKVRRPRGRKGANVGDRTPSSSTDSPSQSPFSPDGPKRPKSGPGSRGGRGSRGKRGISMDQGMSPFQRSLSEVSNSMSSPLAHPAATPLYSQQSFDEGTSDEECDPPPFPRSTASTSSLPSTSSTTALLPSPLTTPQPPPSVFAATTNPIMTPGTLPLPSPSIISVVPSPLVPPSTAASSTPTLVSALSAPSTLAPPLPPPVPPPPAPPAPIASSVQAAAPVPSAPPVAAPAPSNSATPSLVVAPSLVRRKSSLESIVGTLSSAQSKKQRPVSDLFDTGLESPPHASSSTCAAPAPAPTLFAETKTESPKKEGEEKIVLKLKKSTKEPKKKEKNSEKILEKEKEKEKKKEEKASKGGEEKDRKRKADSSTKEKKDKEAKKSKTADPPIIGGGTESFVTKMTMLKGFKIPKNTKGAAGGPGDLSIPSSSSSLGPPLPSPSSLISKSALPTPPSSFSSQSKGGGGPPVAPPPPFRNPQMKGGGPGGPSARPQPPPGRAPKSILKGGPPPAGPPPMAPGRHAPFPPERKISHPPYHEAPRTRHSSGGGGGIYPPAGPPHPSAMPHQVRRGPGPPPPASNWVPLAPRGGPIDGPPTLTPAITTPSHSSRLDQPPTLESNLPARSIVDDSPASPDGLQIVDD